jgi:hypothetical protein
MTDIFARPSLRQQPEEAVLRDAVVRSNQDAAYGAKSALYGLRSSGSNFIGGALGSMGAEEAAAAMYRDADTYRGKAEMFAPRISSFSQLRKEGITPGNALDYAQGILGQTAVSALPAVGAGLVTKNPLAALGVATGAYTPFETGDVIADMRQAQGGALQDGQFGRALAGGAASSALQSVVPAVMGAKLGGQALGRVAGSPATGTTAMGALKRNVGFAAPIEGFAEGGGDVIKQYTADANAPIDWNRTLDAAVGGTVGGGGMGVVGAAADYARGNAGAAANAVQGGVDKAKGMFGRPAAPEGPAGPTGGDSGGDALSRGWDAVRDTASGLYTGLSESDLGKSINERTQKARARIDELMADPNTPADIRAQAEAWGKNVGDKTVQMAAAAASKVREFQAKVKEDGLRKAFTDESRKLVDKIMAGDENLDGADLANATDDQVKSVLQRSSEKAAEYARKWGEDLMQRADVSDATKARVAEAMQNLGDKASRAKLAAEWKAQDVKESVLKKASSFKSFVEGLAKKYKNRDVDVESRDVPDTRQIGNNSKKSEDYSGIQAVIANALRPHLAAKSKAFEEDPASASALADTIREYIEATVDVDGSKYGFDDNDKTLLRAKMVDLLGADTATAMMADVVNAIGTGENRANADRMFYELNELDYIAKSTTDLVGVMEKSVNLGVKTNRQELEQLASGMLSWARGETSSGMTPQQAEFQQRQITREMEKYFGPRAKAVMRQLEKTAAPKSDVAMPANGSEDQLSMYETGIREDDGTPDTSYYGIGTAKRTLVTDPQVDRVKYPGYEPKAEARMKELRQKYPDANVRFVSITEKPEILDLIPAEKAAITNERKRLEAKYPGDDNFSLREQALEDFRAARIKKLKEEGKGMMAVETSPESKLTRAEIDAMRLDTNKFSRSDSRLEVVDNAGTQHVFDAKRIARQGMKKINRERTWTKEDDPDVNPARALLRSFLDGYTSLATELNVPTPPKKIDPENPDNVDTRKFIERMRDVVIGDLGKKPVTFGQVVDMTRQVKEKDAESDKASVQIRNMRKGMEVALQKLFDATQAGDKKEMKAQEKRIKDLLYKISEAEFPKTRELGKDARVDAEVDPLDGTGKQDGDPLGDVVTARATLGEGGIQARTNMDGSVKGRVSDSRPNVKPLLALAERLEDAGGVGERQAAQVRTLAQKFTMLTKADADKLMALTSKSKPSEVGDTLGDLVRKYKDRVVTPSGADTEARAGTILADRKENGGKGSNPKAVVSPTQSADGGRTDNTFTALDNPRYKQQSDQKEMFPLQANQGGAPSPKAVAAQEAAIQQATSAGDATAILKALTARYAPDMDIRLVEGEPKGNGRVVANSDGSFDVSLKKGLTPVQVAATTVHEFGHALMKHSFAKAPAAVRSAIEAAYWADMNAVDGKTKAVLVKHFGHLANAINIENADMSTAAAAAERDAKAGKAGYTLSFDEWFANQVSKYATSTNFEGLTPEVKSFWQKILQTLSDMYQKIAAEMRPADSFKSWMEQLAKQTELRVTEKQAAVLREAADGAKELLASVAASTDIKKLQRVGELLSNFATVGKTQEAIDAIRARIGDLVKDPDAAYAAQTRKYSLEPTNLVGEWLYHGTRADESVLIRPDGSLVLKPSKNFGGKTNGVSFTHDPDSAKDYATRVKGGGPQGFKYEGAKILKIARDALPNVEAETMSEWADYTGQEVVIPPGKYSIESVGREKHFFGDSPLAENFRDWFRDSYGAWEREEIYQNDDWKTDYQERYLDEIVDQADEYSAQDVAEAKAILRDQYGRKFSAERTGPSNGKGMTKDQEKAILDYLDKVLGDRVEVDFADILHAGDFTRKDQADIIRVSVHALNPLSTAYHESLHAFFALLKDKGLPEVQNALQKAVNAPHVVKQLRDRLQHSPHALEQLKDPEERAAYAFQFFMSDPTFKLNPEPRTLFEKIAQKIRNVLGMWSQADRAQKIMEYFAAGDFKSALDKNDMRQVHKDLIEAGRNKALVKAQELSQPLMRLSDTLIGVGAQRLRDTDISSLVQLADLIKTDMGDSSATGGYIPAARLARTNYINRLVSAMKGYTDEQIQDALEALQTGGKAKTPEGRLATREVKAMLREIRDDYLVPAGVRVGDLGEDYFPRVWDAHYISLHQDDFKAMLAKYGINESLMNKLVATDGAEIGVEVNRPGNQHIKERKLHMITEEDAAAFVKKDFWGVMDGYITQATRRAEWARRFNDDNSGYDALLAQARKEGATPQQLKLAEDYVRGVNGTLGDDLSPTARRLMGNMIVYQNIRLLPLAIFSSIVDPMGVLVRGGTVGDAWNSFKRGVKEMPKSWQKDPTFDAATELATTLGVIDDAMMSHFMSQQYTQGMVDGTAKKWNDAFFKYNLMEGYNRSMRVGAMQAAIKFIERHMANPNEHSARYLTELGLTPDNIVIKDGELGLTREDGLTEAQVARTRAAINRWVDGAVLRPDAADKPLWMNDPYWAMISHLKSFVFAFQRTILDRAVHEVKHGNYKPAMALAGYVPIMMAADFTKDMMTNGFEEPEWKKDWTLMDRVEYGVERAGLLGVGEFSTDALKGQWGSLSGPAVDQMTDAVALAGGREEFSSFLMKSMPANALYRGYVD